MKTHIQVAIYRLNILYVGVLYIHTYTHTHICNNNKLKGGCKFEKKSKDRYMREFVVRKENGEVIQCPKII